jgi:hypothetical protein
MKGEENHGKVKETSIKKIIHKSKDRNKEGTEGETCREETAGKIKDSACEKNKSLPALYSQ